ncbi:MAG: Uma2 family endonuclease [Anaerolineae bacterium]|nr:MAG: hypothetical protein UZ13_02069 [Chloroflexi bacterium OLB13]MBC6957815.1 Uma2 family endonuclease [Chloroflexota bacterium]MBV6436851.1 hypothetical protein [Anaerolineae bacterium]OQY82549.1 MAG: hypothetical protein B6D42_09205 [Anaerolineae bacterium UTCFX5]MBW7880095.1 Uma2 family endonuclease [Anaerolineae bacterium]
MVAQSSERIAQMTLEEFLNRPDTNLPMEYEDGEVIMLPMPTTRHQRISRKLTRVIEDMISSGEVFFAPLDVKLGGRVYQPDVFWVKAGSACVDRGSHFDGPPDLVVEIASPSTSRRDRREKFTTYESSGVGEYWLIDPDGAVIEVHTLVDGKYQRYGVFGPEDTFTTPALGADKPISGAVIFAE